MLPINPELKAADLAGHCVSLWDEANAVTDTSSNDYRYRWMCYHLASAQHSKLRAKELAEELGIDPNFIDKP